MNTEQFVEKAKIIHNNKYDYSKVDYINTKTKICIICPKHGEFWMTPHNHIQGRGCKECGKIEQGKSFHKRNKKIFYDELKNFFIEKSIEKHNNKYDYSKVNYINNRTKICIICPKHGEFWMTPRQHINGCGCYACAKENFSSKKKISSEEFIKRAKSIHGNKYDYSKVEYKGAKEKVCIICPKHGEFWQTPTAHVNLKQGCPRCNDSHLEKSIKIFLDNNGIEYIQQCNDKVFTWLNGQSLDFYLPKYNIAIECQGRQHFSENSFSSKNKKRDLAKQIFYDTKKNINCIKNNIKLIYFVDNINYALSSKIKIYNGNNIFDDVNNLIWEKL